MTAPLLVAISCSILFLSILLIKKAVQNITSRRRFAKSSGLPIVKNANIITGHIFSLLFNRRNNIIFGKLHDEYGPSYTWFLCDVPIVHTTDLDLIKTILIDEPFDHLDRFNLVRIPLEEVRESIAFLPKDQWHKHRKAISPAFR